MITVAQLVAIPTLELSYLAGCSGGGRPITWAHTCDMPDPWTWVGAGDLVLTTGGGLPTEPGEQVEWLVKLAGTRASGLLIGARPGTPEVSGRMREKADELRFPLIDARFELEFAGVAHIVIESALRTERERIVEIRRLYDAYGQALRTRVDLGERLRLVAQNLGWALLLRDRHSGRMIASTASTTSRAPGSADEVTEESVNVPGTCPAELIATPARRATLDPLVLHHLAGLIGVELEQRAVERDERRRTGTALLDDLLEGRLPLAAVRVELARRGLPDPLAVVCFSLPEDSEQLHHADALRGCSPLVSRHGDRLLALLPAHPPLLEELLDELGAGTSAGVSSPLAPVLDVPQAARQARLALAHAASEGRRRAEYPELTGLPPRNLPEATEIVTQYLGPLIEHDRTKRTALVDTLRAFLRQDGGWQATAAELGIHRQTLVYRLRTVRQLTGLKPTSSEGTALFWLALRAGEQAGLFDAHSPADSGAADAASPRLSSGRSRPRSCGTH
jgi:purine catabolism regulator